MTSQIDVDDAEALLTRFEKPKTMLPREFASKGKPIPAMTAELQEIETPVKIMKRPAASSKIRKRPAAYRDPFSPSPTKRGREAVDDPQASRAAMPTKCVVELDDTDPLKQYKDVYSRDKHDVFVKRVYSEAYHRVKKLWKASGKTLEESNARAREAGTGQVQRFLKLVSVS